MPQSFQKRYERFVFYTVKLPLIYVAIPLGFIFEYMITFPYMVLSAADNLSRKAKTEKK